MKRKANPEKPRQSLEEYLSSGGKIQKIRPGHAAAASTGKMALAKQHQLRKLRGIK